MQETEKTILNTILTGEAPSFIDQITPGLFMDLGHREIASAICEAKAQNEPIDFVNIGQKIKDPYLLADIADSSPTMHIDFYLKQLQEFAYKKTITQNIKRLAVDCDNPDIEASEIVAGVKSILGISQPKKKSWNIDQLRPSWAFDKPKEFEFIIPNLLAQGLFGWVYGEGGSYKSLAVLWLALQRATAKINAGQKWLEKFEVPFGRTVFISAEDVQEDLHHRVFNITKTMRDSRPDLPIEAIQQAIAENCLIIPREDWVSDGELFLIDSDGIPTSKLSKMVKLIKDFEADLVIIETASRVAAIDENDNSAAARLVAAFERLRDETSATVLCVDHSSKMNRTAKTDTHGQNSLRGAGAKLDNARFGLWFQAMPRKNDADIIKIVNSKSFRCKRADSFTIKAVYPSFELHKEEESEQDVFDLVVQDVRDNPGTKQRQIRARLGGKQSAITRSLKDAVDEGILTHKGKMEGYYYAE